jgi:predicted PurR-regulated permease PerM
VQSLIGPAFSGQRLLRWVAGVLLVLVALWFASRIPRTLTIFLVALFIALGVQPAVVRLERWMNRGYAIAVVYAGLLAVLVVLALLVIPATIEQVQFLVNNAPDYIAAIQHSMVLLTDELRRRLGSRLVPPGVGGLEDFVSSRFSTAFTATLASLGPIVIETVTVLFILLSALVLSAFFLLQGESVAGALYGLFPKQRQRHARALGQEITRILGEYVSGQTLVCAIVGVAIYAATALIGFKFSLLIAILSAIAYAVPVFGMLAAQLVALVLAAPQGAWMEIWVQVIMFTIARVADNLLVPKIMAESIGVSPIVVMFAVFAGGELFGLPGLLLGIPAAALARVIWRFFRRFPATTKIDAAAREVETVDARA